MKKALTLTALIALTGAALALTGCKCPGMCPVKGGKTAKVCACGAPKGSAACAAACKKPELCKCGAPKGSEACAAACKK